MKLTSRICHCPCSAEPMSKRRNIMLPKMPSKSFKTICLLLFVALLSSSLVTPVTAQCPWHRDLPDLQTSCICSYNLGRELSVQCDQVHFPTLLEALNKYVKQKPIDLLYINNSTVGDLTDDIFANLSLHNVQLSSCKISQISDGAFHGQEEVLKNLNLQDNLLEEVPTTALRILKILNLLDLSKNRITNIPDDAFKGSLRLSTLKLNDNNVTLAVGAFRGLENSLKNLNLKGTKQRRVPESIRGLKSLAFLDLSLNGIKELPGPGGIRTFDGLDSLTALNLERNLIQSLGESSFVGVRKTLSSLSLLNNLLADFPVGAIHALKELRVLDIGFNLLTSLPETAFRGNPSITLLALDGNPLATVPETAFLHLNATLRGLSLGGRFLHCDCHLKWVAEWIRKGDLQVTSRERNPQFCGSPPHFRDRGFYSIQPDELTCSETEPELVLDDILPTGQKPTVPSKTVPSGPTNGDALGSSLPTASSVPTTAATLPSSTSSSSVAPTIASTSTTTTTTTTVKTTKATTVSTPAAHSSDETPGNSSQQEQQQPAIQPTHQSTSGIGSASPTTITQSQQSNGNAKQSPSWRQNSSGGSSSSSGGPAHKQQRPPLVLGFPPQRGTRIDDSNEVQVKNAFRQDSSVIIQWDSDTANILGFRVVYRLFGEKSFKQGPPLEASEREFKIKNVPAQECIIVCVISLEELHVTPETVPYQQCREVRTVASQTSNMDKITIAASAAICGTIIVAVIVFIAASRRSRKMQTSQQKSPLPIGGLPVNCCGPAGSPGPLGSIATLSAFNNHKEWDQVSAYSGRSIPRPRAYPMDAQDDMRSHFSGMPGKLAKPRYSTAGSTHTLNNYCDTSDNWTDHDMDIYMARNPTTRNGLVPL
ncbi:leucine-rich repeat and fibronectin type-III domain-containing protein 3 isoform X2 [Musca domestica]|uniref:Leucine-rich repeat and fibronectin type-III domain-containing protein 3 isoform X2 n=1 Tax=Musca domestica TaxID=7370 RepID=A0A1I8MDZ4_MUSDO|nr:leucine-rich repeat and fibronectin type-III domain-containing protein 3 isoform X2 [Musca domestica]